MTGGKKGRGKGAQSTTNNHPHRTGLDEEDDMREEEDRQNGGESTSENVSTGLETLSKQISDLKSELKEDLKTFKDEIKHDMREEFIEFKQEVNQQLSTNMLTMQEHGRKINEMETRIDDTETWSAEANSALQQAIKDQQKLEDRLNDIESRARRNNIRIHGVPENAEQGSVIEFVEKMLRSEFELGDVDLQIQRAHRALAPRPGPNSRPRSIIVNFQQYSIKEMVIQKAWRKKIMMEDKPLFFDHDYTATVLHQRKAYANIKKALKEKGIRFQTPFNRIRIHWEEGVQVYGSAGEAAQELRRRGYSVEMPVRPPGKSHLLDRLQRATSWQRVGSTTSVDTARRAKERLREFEHGRSNV